MHPHNSCVVFMMQESVDAEGPVVEKIMSSRTVKKKVNKTKALPATFLNRLSIFLRKPILSS